MEPDTRNRIARFISSQQMESSEIQKRTINLGRALVEELGLDPGTDTLARWMAHYIAEQITAAEQVTGEEKSQTEQHCFETILKLWQHRASLPDGNRPFESFEPIFRALSRLDPDNTSPFFYSSPNHRTTESPEQADNLDEVEPWLDIAREIERTARLLLRYVFRQAALAAANDKTATWLENAVAPYRNGDVLTIVYLMTSEADKDDDGASQHRSLRMNKLSSMIENLDQFVELSRNLRASLANELDTISNSSV